jgi:hypothetical protein
VRAFSLKGNLMQFDRAQMERLRHAIDADPRALRRDSSGAWIIRGKHGHIAADGQGWLMQWTAAGTALSRRFEWLTFSPTDAAAIRDAIGVKRSQP